MSGKRFARIILMKVLLDIEQVCAETEMHTRLIITKRL